MTIKETPLKSHYSQTATAALMPCSPNSWRLFEASPNAVTPELRARCEAALEKLRAQAEKQSGVNRRNKSAGVAATWAEFRAAEEKARTEPRMAAVAHREHSIRTWECVWAAQVPDDWSEPAYQVESEVVRFLMKRDLNRGRSREKKIHNVAAQDDDPNRAQVARSADSARGGEVTPLAAARQLRRARVAGAA